MPGYLNESSEKKYLNESAADAFTAIVQSIKDFRTELAKTKAPNELKKSSIMRAAKDLTLSFPVLYSDSIDPATAMIINKSVERNIVSTLQMLFSAYHVTANNAFDFIAKFHNNMDNNLDITDYMDYASAAIKNASNYKIGGSAVRAADSFFRLGSLGEEAKICFKKQCEHFYPESSFNETAIGDFYVDSDYQGLHVGKHVLTEASKKNKKDSQQINIDYTDKSTNRDKDTEIRLQSLKRNLNSLTGQDRRDYIDANKIYQDEIKIANQADKNKNDKEIADDNLALARQNMAIANAKNNLEREKLAHQIDYDNYTANRNLLQKQLLPTDVQKINELVPTLMIIRFAVEFDNGAVTYQDAVIGVKCRMSPVPAQEVADAIGNYKKGAINQLNLSRATTKEISLSKDFVAAIKDAKIDAKKNSLSQVSPQWRSLQSRSANSNLRRLVHGRNTAAAITTLVITSQEVDYIRSNYRVNIDSTNEAVAFMAKFNLMGLVIVDEQTEVARFIMDGDRYFSSYTFTSLERENKDSISNRTVVNLLSKINR